MPSWLDKIKDKAKDTLNDQEKMDRLKAKAQETLGDPEKRAMIQQKAEGVLGHLTHRDQAANPASASTVYSGDRVRAADSVDDEGPLADEGVSSSSPWPEENFAAQRGGFEAEAEGEDSEE